MFLFKVELEFTFDLAMFMQEQLKCIYVLCMSYVIHGAHMSLVLAPNPFILTFSYRIFYSFDFTRVFCSLLQPEALCNSGFLWVTMRDDCWTSFCWGGCLEVMQLCICSFRADKSVMASSGFQADVKALQKNLAARHLVSGFFFLNGDTWWVVRTQKI